MIKVVTERSYTIELDGRHIGRLYLEEGLYYAVISLGELSSTDLRKVAAKLDQLNKVKS